MTSRVGLAALRRRLDARVRHARLRLGSAVEHRRAEVERYAAGAAGSPAEVVARIDAIGTARKRLAQNVPEQLALEAMMLALLPTRLRTPRPPR